MILTEEQLYAHSGINQVTESRELETRCFSASALRVFLSHKHTDEKQLFAVKRLLEQIGAKPYVDWMDRSLPKTTSAVTASKIKGKIEKCNKFIFIATNAALDSPWCNWEIGYADAYKYNTDKIALFAVSKNNEQWKGNEYMQLYPVIEYEDGTTNYSNGEKIPEGYYVELPMDKNGNRQLISLKNWLLK